LLWFVAALSGTLTLLLGLAGAWTQAALFLTATLVVVLGARATTSTSVTERWSLGDIVLVIAILLVAQAYAGIFAVLGKSPASSAVQLIAAYVGTGAGVLLVIVLRRGVKPHDFGLRLPSSSIWFLVTPLFVIAALISSSELQSWQSHLQTFHGLQNTQCAEVKDSFGTNALGFALALPCVSIAAPLVEETIFRGLIYGWLASLVKNRDITAALPRRLGLAAAMLVSGLIFGAFHSLAFGILPILPLASVGVLLAALYEWSKSLYPGMVVHASFNTVGLVFLLLTANSC